MPAFFLKKLPAHKPVSGHLHTQYCGHTDVFNKTCLPLANPSNVIFKSCRVVLSSILTKIFQNSHEL